MNREISITLIKTLRGRAAYNFRAYRKIRANPDSFARELATNYQGRAEAYKQAAKDAELLLLS